MGAPIAVRKHTFGARPWPAKPPLRRHPPPTTSAAWAEEFDATLEQIEEAIAAVGPGKADIELHLKGSRSTSNSDRVHDAGA